MVNTVTQYRSPVRLVKHTAEDVEPYSSQAISRARKKMMAEIALGGDEVVIDDVPYSRNDASTLLDLVTEESWRSHSIIYAQKGLLNFLEKEEFNNEELKKADAYLYDQRFVQAVSPYFAHAFNAVSGRLLRLNNFEELLRLLSYQGYIVPEHSHEAYQKLRTYLDELNYTLRNLSWEKFIADESVLHFVFSDEWKKCLNRLPSSFATVRDELVDNAIGIVLRFQHKATWYYLHQVLVQLKTIETNDFNRSEIQRIDAIIYENSKIEGGKGKVTTKKAKDSEVSTGRIIWWGIWIILMIIRVATCNNRSSNSSYSYKDYYSDRRVETPVSSSAEKRNEQLLLSVLDSLGEKKNLPVIARPLKTGDQPFDLFADDPNTLRNDSIIVENNSGYDAVFLYFKDIPGHYRSGLLPKVYATYIEKGESRTLSILPNNGRIYFAFGKEWGRLKKPVEISLKNILNPIDNPEQTITVDQFFRNTTDLQQTLLHNETLIDATLTYNGNYRYLNRFKGWAKDQITKIVLQRAGNGFTASATGRLYVKQAMKDAANTNDNKVEGEPPPTEEQK